MAMLFPPLLGWVLYDFYGRNGEVLGLIVIHPLSQERGQEIMLQEQVVTALF
jgi:hypothetical protein